MKPQNSLIGIVGGSRAVYRKYPFPRALSAAFQQTVQLARTTVGMLRDLIATKIAPEAAFTGPLGIFKESGKAAEAGFGALVMLVALISISVGILNLFPLPPLDGGHLAILIVESVIRRDMTPAAKLRFLNVGAILILILIAAVLYMDVAKLELFKPALKK